MGRLTDWWRDIKASLRGRPHDTASYRSAGLVDLFGLRREPTIADLVRRCTNIAYTCAQLNAQAIASTPLRLYATTSAGQKRPRVPHRPVSRRTKAAWSATRPDITKRVAGAEAVDEITEHPLLDLLDHPCADLDRCALIELISLYLDISGVTYLWPEQSGQTGVAVMLPADRLWVLPSHQVTPTRDLDTRDDPALTRVARYDYVGDRITRTYTADELIVIRMRALTDPYLRPWSPFRAAWESVLIHDEYLAYEQAIVTNRARPDYLITPADAAMPLGEEEARRIEASLVQRFGRSASGRPLVARGALSVTPLAFPPRDMADLDIRRSAKVEICNAFQVPIALLESKDVNRANAEAAHVAHGRLAIRPRCRRIDAALTRGLAARYDERLFFAFDDPVPDDAETRARVYGMWLDHGVLSINEVRTEEGWSPVAGADELLVPSQREPLSRLVDPSPPLSDPYAMPADEPDIDIDVDA